jgi:hypothetical protein
MPTPEQEKMYEQLMDESKHLMDFFIDDFTHYDGIKIYERMKISHKLILWWEKKKGEGKVACIYDKDDNPVSNEEQNKDKDDNPVPNEEQNKDKDKDKKRKIFLLGYIPDSESETILKFLKMGHDDIFEAILSGKSEERLRVTVRIKKYVMIKVQDNKNESEENSENV